MGMQEKYSGTEPKRADIDAMKGAVVVEFGTGWCGHCRAVQPLLAQVFAQHPQVRHFKVEDGPGRPLGRSFGVKLWPSLIFMRDGKEVSRVVRPTDLRAVREAFGAMDTAAAQ